MLPDAIRSLHTGSLKDARDIAHADVKFLCILLVCSDHPCCTTSTLNAMLGGGKVSDANSTELKDLLERRCVIWAADVDSGDAAENSSSVLTTCNPVAFPYFAVTFKSQVHCEVQGEFTPTQLRDALHECMQDAEAEVAKEIGFAADRAARKAEHDAYQAQKQAVIDEDRRREQAKREAEEKKQREEQAERDRLQRLLREAEARSKAEEQAKLEAEQRKALAVSAVPDEPAADVPADQITTIRLTRLDGTSVTRKFLRTTSLAGLYCWAESLPEYDGSVAYELVAGVPPSPLQRADDVTMDDVTVGSKKVLIPRCVVTMSRK